MTPAAPRRTLPQVVDLGEHVVVPTWVLAVLHTAPESGINEFRRTIRGRDPALDDALRGLCLASTSYLERRTGTATGPTGAAPTDPAPSSAGRLTSTQAADQLGVTPRQVRRLVTEGQLRADRPGYGYLLDADDVAALRARRAG